MDHLSTQRHGGAGMCLVQSDEVVCSKTSAPPEVTGSRPLGIRIPSPRIWGAENNGVQIANSAIKERALLTQWHCGLGMASPVRSACLAPRFTRDDWHLGLVWHDLANLPPPHRTSTLRTGAAAISTNPFFPICGGRRASSFSSSWDWMRLRGYSLAHQQGPSLPLRR